MRLLIAGGGTGGHLSPALAIAEAFRTEVPEGELLMVGKVGGLEERLVPEADLPLETIRISGFNRDHLWRNLVLPVGIPTAFARGVKIVERFRPDVVLGVGGYVMAPAVYGAQRLKIPYVLAVFEASGLANRMFRSRAAAACVTFPEDVEAFPTPRTVLTGYPLRRGFSPGNPSFPPRRLLVLGGSQGARQINRAIWAALPELLKRFELVIHQTGAQGEAEAAQMKTPGYQPIAFSREMPRLLAESDLVIGRAGVGTIAEVTAVGLPMILIPGTFGSGHQERNAMAMVKAGAAVKIPDQELTPQRLLMLIDSLDLIKFQSMAHASAGLGRPHAAAEIVRVLREVGGGD